MHSAIHPLPLENACMCVIIMWMTPWQPQLCECCRKAKQPLTRTACMSLDHSLICNKVHLMSLISPFFSPFSFVVLFFSDLHLNPEAAENWIDSSDGWIVWKCFFVEKFISKIMQHFALDDVHVSSFHYFDPQNCSHYAGRQTMHGQCNVARTPGTCMVGTLFLFLTTSYTYTFLGNKIWCQTEPFFLSFTLQLIS